MTEPSEHDRENARRRQEIAARQQEEWDRVYHLAKGMFGEGWEPSGRHFLLDKADEDRCRRTGERPTPAATCYTVRREGGEKRHFTVEDGLAKECSGYEEGFGAMLLEPHPTMRIEVKGKLVSPHRYSLCWAPIETYEPKTAEQLAALRASREQKKAKRAQQKYEENYPLFAIIDRKEKEGHGR